MILLQLTTFWKKESTIRILRCFFWILDMLWLALTFDLTFDISGYYSIIMAKVLLHYKQHKVICQYMIVFLRKQNALYKMNRSLVLNRRLNIFCLVFLLDSLTVKVLGICLSVSSDICGHHWAVMKPAGQRMTRDMLAVVLLHLSIV